MGTELALTQTHSSGDEEGLGEFEFKGTSIICKHMWEKQSGKKHLTPVLASP